MKKSMKIIIAVAMTLALTIGLCACGGPTDEQRTDIESKAKECRTLYDECVDLLKVVEDNEYYDELVKAMPDYEEKTKSFYDLEKSIKSFEDIVANDIDSIDEESADTLIKGLDEAITALKGSKAEFEIAVDELEKLPDAS